MTQTSTEICNLALDKLGQGGIDSIEEQTRVPRLCKRQYEQGRETILSVGAWSFAKKYATLALNVEDPPFDFAYSHKLPTDFLRIWSVNGVLCSSLTNYDVVGENLYSDLSRVELVYIRNVTSVPLMHPLFVQALFTWMASGLAQALTGDRGRQGDLMQEAQGILETALSVDALQLPNQEFSGNDIIDARYT